MDDETRNTVTMAQTPNSRASSHEGRNHEQEESTMNTTPKGAALSDADERTRFEAWAVGRDFDVARFAPNPDIYSNAYTADAWDAWESRGAADRRLTAEQGGAEPPKPFCRVVNMKEGLPEPASYIMLFDGQRLGNGFTHTALYTGEQLVAALTTQPQAEPAASLAAIHCRLKFGGPIDSHTIGTLIAECEHAIPALAQITAPTEPT